MDGAELKDFCKTSLGFLSAAWNMRSNLDEAILNPKNHPIVDAIQMHTIIFWCRSASSERMHLIIPVVNANP
jgi:hypothetical protein